MMEKVGESWRRVGALVGAVKADYVAWIVKHPSRASDTESGVKLISYLLHGRLKKSSTLLPELIYCSANLLSFWHDRLIQENERRKQGLGADWNGNGNGERGAGRDGDLRNGQPPSDGPSRSAQQHVKLREAREGHIQRIRTTLTIIDYLEVFLEVGARHLWGDVGRWIVIVIIQSVK